MDSHGTPDSSHGVAGNVDDACIRCGGLMVLEHYMDLLDDTGQIGVTAFRCTSCGEVVDPTILRNRIEPPPNLLYGTKQRQYAQQIDREKSGGSASDDVDDHDETGESG